MLQIFRHFFFVCPDTLYTVDAEAAQTVTEQGDGLQEVINNHRHEDIQLKITLTGRKADGRIISHDLYGYHGHRFTLCRIHLSRHNAASWLIFRYPNFLQTTTRPACQPAYIICHLHTVCRQCLQRTMGKADIILRRQSVEFVRVADKLSSQLIAQPFTDEIAESLRGIQSGTDCRPSNGKLTQGIDCLLQHIDIVLQHASPSADFL